MSTTKRIRGTLPGRTHVTGPGGLDAPAFARWYRERISLAWQSLDLGAVARLASAVVEAQEKDRRVFVMGNGGSAATASHIATDLSKTAAVPGRKPVQCLSLADNAAYMTAIANDISFDAVFSRQLENLLKPKDVVILVSGSGNSPNLLEAARLANRRGALTAGLLGFDGGRLKPLVRLCLLVASDQYGVIEDVHMGIGHILTFYLKQRR